MENDMRKLFGTILITTATLAATSAFPENVVWEHRAEREQLWDNTRARATPPGELLDRIFGQTEFRHTDNGTAEASSDSWWTPRNDTRQDNGAWAGNFHAGKVYESSGH
jgi:hypothetical protein